MNISPFIGDVNNGHCFPPDGTGAGWQQSGRGHTNSRYIHLLSYAFTHWKRPYANARPTNARQWPTYARQWPTHARQWPTHVRQWPTYARQWPTHVK